MQYCLEANANAGLAIAVTQPRRVAAVTLAYRVASEMGLASPGGQVVHGFSSKSRVSHFQVGYSVRFDRVASDHTRILYMTDGMLLREALHDPLLSRCASLIIIPASVQIRYRDDR